MTNFLIKDTALFFIVILDSTFFALTVYWDIRLNSKCIIYNRQNRGRFFNSQDSVMALNNRIVQDVFLTIAYTTRIDFEVIFLTEVF
jgi:hypothetical protein